MCVIQSGIKNLKENENCLNYGQRIKLQYVYMNESCNVSVCHCINVVNERARERKRQRKDDHRMKDTKDTHKISFQAMNSMM